MLNFVKPICFFDLETTGVDTEKDRIVEICIKMFSSESAACVGTFYSLVNPEIPIPKSASDIHHITDEMVATAPTFKMIATDIFYMISGCDLGGFNSNRFDIPLLVNEMDRVGVSLDMNGVEFFDVMNIYKGKEKRDLASAVRFYLGREHEGAHGAAADIDATAELFFEQMRRYDWGKDATPNTISLFSNNGKRRADIAGKFAYNDEGMVVFNFGQHNGKLAQSEPAYLSWMMSIKASFSKDTKEWARKLAYGPSTME